MLKKYLFNVLNNIKTISSLFMKTVVIFGYNHSKDTSLQIVDMMGKLKYIVHWIKSIV